jgi:integrase
MTKNFKLPRRVYAHHGAYFLVDNEHKWHRLCKIDEGEKSLYKNLAEKLDELGAKRLGSMPRMLAEYQKEYLPTLAVTTRIQYEHEYANIAKAFGEFNYDEITPKTVNNFLKQFKDRPRTRQSYKSRLSSFFAWCVVEHDLEYNPVREVSIAPPDKRDRYITHAEFHRIREALLTGERGGKTLSGDMMQCFVDLCYLTAQRSTEIRNLKWSVIGDALTFDVNPADLGLTFKPSKTQRTSKAKVKIVVTDVMRAVFERARSIGKVKGLYVIHTLDGQCYTASGARSAWNRACVRAGVQDATIKDLRAKALTDAKELGYTIEEIKVAAAHSSITTTQGYIKTKEIPQSVVELPLPPKAGKS